MENLCNINGQNLIKYLTVGNVRIAFGSAKVKNQGGSAEILLPFSYRTADFYIVATESIRNATIQAYASNKNSFMLSSSGISNGINFITIGFIN